jgi:fucose 4-O-acetylase-like acetyltransferase
MNAPVAADPRGAARLSWIDTARGAGIVLVVAGHTERGLLQGGLLVHTEAYAWLDNRIYAFHMPLFFLLSGVFFLGSLERRSAGMLLWSKIVRLLFPLLIWTPTFIAFKVVAGTLANTPADWSDVFASPIPGKLHFWFLWALFVMQSAMLVAKPLVARAGRRTVALCVLALSVALALFGEFGPAARYVGRAALYAPFFALGMVLGSFRLPPKAPAAAAWISATILAATLLLLPLDYMTSGVLRLIAGGLLSVCFVVVVAGLGDGRISGWLATLGRCSMAIYLAHTIFSAALRALLVKAGVIDETAQMLLGTAVGLGAPMALFSATQRLGVSKYLGF